MKIRIVLIIAILLLGQSICMAQSRYRTDLEFSSIKASNSFFVIPKLHGDFKDFTGIIYYDPKDLKRSSVLMKIDANSISTGNERYDRIIRSERVLDTDKFPEIIFKSTTVGLQGKNFFVLGELDLHGIKREIRFPFKLDGPFKDEKNREYVEATGVWNINRKDHSVIWHKVLDKGGILIGNNVSIEWRLIAFKE